jgi:hypothetical protein
MEVEVLLKAMGGAGRHHPYRDRLEDYRRRLTGNGADQTAADYSMLTVSPALAAA